MNTSAPKQVALYARVSTKGLGQDPEGQLISLREYAGRRGWTIVGTEAAIGRAGGVLFVRLTYSGVPRIPRS